VESLLGHHQPMTTTINYFPRITAWFPQRTWYGHRYARCQATDATVPHPGNTLISNLFRLV
jgi:hypothetical protein